MSELGLGVDSCQQPLGSVLALCEALPECDRYIRKEYYPSLDVLFKFRDDLYVYLVLCPFGSVSLTAYMAAHYFGTDIEQHMVDREGKPAIEPMNLKQLGPKFPDKDMRMFTVRSDTPLQAQSVVCAFLVEAIGPPHDPPGPKMFTDHHGFLLG
jgi:hypothetical protein